jgi:hypothetical protein
VDQVTANGIDDTADLERLLARLMVKLFPGLAFLNVRTYKVIKVYSGATDYGRCDLALESDPEQQIPRVDQWPGIPGGVGLPAVGSLCEVTWRDGEQKSPVIVGFSPLRTTGGKPTESKIDAAKLILGPTSDHVVIANGDQPAARKGDAVGCGLLTVAMVAGVPTFTYTPPGGAPVTGVTVTLGGVITGGSAKVTIG